LSVIANGQDISNAALASIAAQSLLYPSDAGSGAECDGMLRTAMRHGCAIVERIF
jgi:hypothetical protein